MAFQFKKVIKRKSLWVMFVLLWGIFAFYSKEKSSLPEPVSDPLALLNIQEQPREEVYRSLYNPEWGKCPVAHPEHYAAEDYDITTDDDDPNNLGILAFCYETNVLRDASDNHFNDIHYITYWFGYCNGTNKWLYAPWGTTNTENKPELYYSKAGGTVQATKVDVKTVRTVNKLHMRELPIEGVSVDNLARALGPRFSSHSASESSLGLNQVGSLQTTHSDMKYGPKDVNLYAYYNPGDYPAAQGWRNDAMPRRFEPETKVYKAFALVRPINYNYAVMLAAAAKIYREQGVHVLPKSNEEVVYIVNARQWIPSGTKYFRGGEVVSSDFGPFETGGRTATANTNLKMCSSFSDQIDTLIGFYQQPKIAGGIDFDTAEKTLLANPPGTSN